MTTTAAAAQPAVEEKAITAEPVIWLGVDTHQQIHHAAVITAHETVLGDLVFPATAAGYADLAGWAATFGVIAVAGVEQTGTYGAGLTRYLQSVGITVVEVNRPDAGVRAARGKDDRTDAIEAARAALSGRARVIPKDRNGIGEAIRNLHVARELAVKHRVADRNQLRDLITTAPDDLRDQLLPLTSAARVAACADLTPAGDVLHRSVMTALRSVAAQIHESTRQITALDKELGKLVRHAAPRLLACRQVGPQVAAQLLITAGQNPDRLHSEAAFARLCGIAPIPASSGKTTDRHRLHRGGDRQANRAIYMVAVGRMKDHQPTLDYVAKKTAPDGTRATPHIIRCLKRYIARELFTALKHDLAALDKL